MRKKQYIRNLLTLDRINQMEIASLRATCEILMKQRDDMAQRLMDAGLL